MHDLDKLTKLFDAALQQETNPVDVPTGSAATIPASSAWGNGPHGMQTQASPEQQEYARQLAWQQHLAEQQQRAAHEQQQMDLRRQAYEQQQQAHARQQAWEQHQQLLERQRAFALQQEAAAQHSAPSSHLGEPQQNRGPQQTVAHQHDTGLRQEHPSSPASGTATTPQEAQTPTGFFFHVPGKDVRMEASEEFSAIIDAKMARTRKKHSRSFLFTLVLFFAPILGGSGWFISNPERVDTLRAVTSEIRSAGDITAIIAKYRKALDKVAVRGKHLDEASAMMGIDPDSVPDDDDGFLDHEMRDMAGADGGPTVTQRNQRFKATFGEIREGKGIGAKYVKMPGGAEK